MNIDCDNKTITCNCGNIVQIKNANLIQSFSNQPFFFECNRCKLEQTIPIAFNIFLTKEISKHVLPQNSQTDDSTNDFADIFLGQNQVPLTDELIDRLVKGKDMNRDELKYMQKEGAQYSISRNSFIFPTKTNF